MMRSLFAGVSGLRNHQLRMDVIGHNIANINTVGFKSGRVTFQESLSQLLRGASRPTDIMGGQNPMQVGTGMQVGSIDMLFTQGSLEPTGQISDLAIQGDGFFMVSDGVLNYYTRAGNFQVDGQGKLIHPGTGCILQGIMADDRGVIDSSGNIGHIVLPFGQKVPAKATSRIDFSCNLNNNSEAVAQVLAANFAKAAQADATAAPTSLIITAATNDVLDITVEDYMGTVTNKQITLSAGTYASVTALVEEINTQIQADADLKGKVAANVISVGGSDAVQISSSEVGGSSTKLTIAGIGRANLNLPATVQTGSIGATLLNDLPAVVGDLTSGDELIISGVNPDGSTVSYTYTYTLGDDIDDLLTEINTAFVNITATIDERGRIKITDTLAAESTTNITMTLQDVDDSGSIFNIPSFLTLVEGRDAGTHTASISAYDSLGEKHSVAITFTNISTADVTNKWSWQVTVDDGEVIPLTGGAGYVTFDSDGSLLVFTGNDGQPLTFDPGNGGEVLSITLNAGEAGGFGGITQLSSPSTTVAKYQDGYGMGNLQSISFDETGTVTGQFTNGITQALAQLVLATFNNPAGMQHEGNNLFTETANSGNAVKGLVGASIPGSISPGTLEMSNVDLAEEFTQMIIAQRGFQANARVISTADTILDEIVRLKR